MMRIFFISCWFICFVFCPTSTWAQGNQEEFGKNRVQYHDFDWVQYESPNFVTYWYGDGRMVGQAVVQMAEMDYQEIQNTLEHRLNRKIQILVFTDLTDFKQSNVGSEEIFTNTGGQTKIAEDKIFLYFDGDHNHLRRQLREGIASVHLNAMMFGNSIQEIVQNAVLLNLPDWFVEGLSAYVGEEWGVETDAQMRDLFTSGKFKNFNKLVAENPRLAGHSLWYFIGQNYGKASVSNLLYLTRINRSTHSGFLYVLGTSYERTIQSWQQFFEQRYKNELLTAQEIDEKTAISYQKKFKKRPKQFKISPNGKQFAYVLHEMGRYHIYIQDAETKKRTLVHKGGFRNSFQEVDYNYPLVAWSKNAQELFVIYEERDVVKSLLYNVGTGEKIHDLLPPQYERVLSIDFLNAQEIVLAAIVGGYSDLFIYRMSNRASRRLTSDFYDDLEVCSVNLLGKKGILFTSNRPDTSYQSMKLDSILPLQRMDVFYCDLSQERPYLLRVTDTPLGNEQFPSAIDSTYFAFLSDVTGVRNRYVGFLEDYISHYEKTYFLKDGKKISLHADSLLNVPLAQIDSTRTVAIYKTRAITKPNSNRKESIQALHSAELSPWAMEIMYKNGKYTLHRDSFYLTKKYNPLNTEYQQQQWKNYLANTDKIKLSNIRQEAPDKPIAELVELSALPTKSASPDTIKIDYEDYYFQTPFEDFERPLVVLPPKPQDKKSDAPESSVRKYMLQQVQNNKLYTDFRSSRIVPYRLKFRTNVVTTQMDNSLLFGGLDNYAANRMLNNGSSSGFQFPQPGILIKGNVQDLFEDYQLEGGFRFPTTFSGFEAFVTFKDRKKQLDKFYSYYRNQQTHLLDDVNIANSPIFTTPVPPNPNIPITTNPFLAYRLKTVTDLLSFEGRYPLDIFTSLRARLNVRNDKIIFSATDGLSLYQPVRNEQRLGLRLEYVFDNTLETSLNLKNGTRYKFFGEVTKGISVNVLEGFQFDFQKGISFLLGLDARHYQRLDRHSIVAMRMAAATSFGSQKMLYMLGGVDSPLLPSFESSVPVPNSSDYIYQSPVANMRGFGSNIRNGSSYVLSNTELRVPIFKYFYNRPIRSSFLRNFQMVGFFDIGTAWTGWSPFSKTNPLNTIQVGNPDIISLEVTYFRDPVVASYGLGVRSMVFGYFVRVDYGFGIETRVVQKPVWSISLGTDF